MIRVKYATPTSKGEMYDYRCSGSLINENYVLTASWCFTRTYFSPIEVRLGDYHFANETDCINDGMTYRCVDNSEMFGIAETIIHPNYDGGYASNDVGLIRLNKTVKYTDYIRPVCLPLHGVKRGKIGDVLTVNGWGFLRIDKYGETKTKVTVILRERSDCLRARNDESKICTGPLSNNTSSACFYGNVGSSVVFSNENQWHQEAVVSGLSYCFF
ncbi:hypothetical protein ILUMI_25388 [Ignelater luminosus]|uniref:Peptidase S1 domain-containing protein n=1 Tax=Ignelater luminosus TaxID=2038154 RepID=A0A8K0C4U9_IGNLU|nr:hypothetical protein ILUMI_25388 [Ignelater luminosus]